LRLISRTNSRRWQAFSAKLFTFSHNSQNRDPFDTQLAFKRTKAHLSPAQNKKLRIKNTAGIRSLPSSPARVPPILSPRASGSKPEKANLRRTRL
jgi:type VI protein secretion system component VasA